MGSLPGNRGNQVWEFSIEKVPKGVCEIPTGPEVAEK